MAMLGVMVFCALLMVVFVPTESVEGKDAVPAESVEGEDTVASKKRKVVCVAPVRAPFSSLSADYGELIDSMNRNWNALTDEERARLLQGAATGGSFNSCAVAGQYNAEEGQHASEKQDD